MMTLSDGVNETKEHGLGLVCKGYSYGFRRFTILSRIVALNDNN